MKIVYFGDSITQGFQLLSKHDNVVNMGISGHKINNLIGRFQDVLLEKPDRLIIMIGINDYLDSNHYWGTPINLDIPLMYTILLKLINDNLPNCDVVLLSILPVSMDTDKETLMRFNSEIESLNQDIVILSQSYEYDYVDLHSLFLDNEGFLNQDYTTDGVHLSPKGYEFYYQLILELLVES